MISQWWWCDCLLKNTIIIVVIVKLTDKVHRVLPQLVRTLCKENYLLIHKGQCGCVCLFSIEIQMAGQIGTKFGTEVVLEGGRFLGFFDPVPHPPGTGCVKGVPLEPQPCDLAKTL